MASVASREHLRFCELDGWSELKAARGGGRDHVYLIKELADGRTLRTKVSHGGHGKKAYGKGMWRRIWSEELGLASEAEFFAVLRERRPAERGDMAPAPVQEALPVWLVERLIYSAGLREDEVAALSLTEAHERWQAYQARPKLSDLESSAAYAGATDLSESYGLSVS